MEFPVMVFGQMAQDFSYSEWLYDIFTNSRENLGKNLYVNLPSGHVNNVLFISQGARYCEQMLHKPIKEACNRG